MKTTPLGLVAAAIKARQESEKRTTARKVEPALPRTGQHRPNVPTRPRYEEY